jgi:carboxylesterase
VSDLINNLSFQYAAGRTNKAVVLLYGLCGSSLEMGSLPKEIAKHGHTICIPIIKGYCAQSGLSDYKTWLEQLHNIVTLLAEDHDSVSIVGLSMGATLALAYESKFKKCSSVVALAPVFFYDGWNVPWYSPALFLLLKLGIRKWSIKETEPFGLKNTEIRGRIAKKVLVQEVTEVGSSRLSGGHLKEGLRLIAITKKMLVDYKADLMVISAIDDDVTSPKSAEWISANVMSHVKKFVWLGNSYHIITLDNEREIVVNETVEFLHTSFANQQAISSYNEETQRMIIKNRFSSDD